MVLALGFALLPFRSHISVSTAALVFVVPVVIGAVIGGFNAGIACVVAGFLVYDFGFVPPFNTLEVGSAENWTALVVYVIVMLLVARVVSNLDSSRLGTLRVNDSMRKLSELSEYLVGDRPVDELLQIIVNAAHTSLGVPSVSLLVLEEGRLSVTASAGEPLTDDDLRQLDPLSGTPVSIGTAPSSPGELRSIALSASGRAVGILAMRGLPESKADRAILNTFANDAALAIERAQLRELALRTKLLEEVDRIRHGLMGAVSHDLRSPLATIKVASSTLTNNAVQLSTAQTRELYELIEIEADRLTRLVTNLLDMTRIEAGVFTVERSPVAIKDLVSDAILAMGATITNNPVTCSMPDSTLEVKVDRLLIGQALINLIDNALRHSPPGSVVTVHSAVTGGRIIVSVIDHGPGVPVEQRAEIFDRFTQFDTGGRAGLGLTIAKTFIEAHGEKIWYEESSSGGAVFAFSLPLVDQYVEGGRE